MVLAGVTQSVVEEDDHGLAFGDGGARGVLLVGIERRLVVLGESFDDAVGPESPDHVSRSTFWSWRAWVSSWARTGFWSSGAIQSSRLTVLVLSVVEAGDLLGEETRGERGGGGSRDRGGRTF